MTGASLDLRVSDCSAMSGSSDFLLSDCAGLLGSSGLKLSGCAALSLSSRPAPVGPDDPCAETAETTLLPGVPLLGPMYLAPRLPRPHPCPLILGHRLLP